MSDQAFRTYRYANRRGITARLLGFLLYLANEANVPVLKHRFFRQVKDTILLDYGLYDNCEYQEIIKPCWNCNGDENVAYPCYRCGGDGVFERVVVRLDRFHVGGFLFYKPNGRVYSDVPITIKGLIRPRRNQALACEAMVILFLLYDPDCLSDVGRYTFTCWKLPVTWMVCVYNRLRRPWYSHCRHCDKRYKTLHGFKEFCSTDCFLEHEIGQEVDDIPF